MTENLNHRALRLSQKVFAGLLFAYPGNHRREYGAAMAQLFRDQCRDAWNESRGWGLFKLWLRVLPDLVKTSILERIANLNRKKSMTEKIANLSGAPSAASTFFRAAIPVFLVTVLISVVVTFLLPETYSSTARIKVLPDDWMIKSETFDYDPYFVQTTFETIKSPIVLKPVVDRLKLKELWNKKYAVNMTDAAAIGMLKSKMQLTPVPHTQLINIEVFSENPKEAAQIANAIVESYRDYREKFRADLVKRGLAVLEQQFQMESNQISQIQAQSDALRQQFNIADATASSPEEYLRPLNEHKMELEKNYQMHLAQLTELKKLNQNQLRDVLPQVAADTTLANLLGRLQAAEQDYQVLINTSASNIEITRAKSLIEILRRQVDERTAGVMFGLETQVKAQNIGVDTLSAAVEHRKETAGKAKPYWDKKQELSQTIERQKELESKIETEKNDLQIPKPALVQITDPAEPGHSPVRPNKPLNIFIGIVAGAFLGLAIGAIVLLLSKWRNRGGGNIAAA